MSIYNSLFLCSKLQITRSDFCAYALYIKGIYTIQGEEHLGKATFQALFIVNSDYYQTNWHSYNAAVYQLGPFFFLQAIILHIVYHLKGKIQLLLLTKYCVCPTQTEVEKCPHSHTLPGAVFHLHTF